MGTLTSMTKMASDRTLQGGPEGIGGLLLRSRMQL
jgi:hypothetical protein